MDQQIIDLYDLYTHGGMSRRSFLDKLAALAGSTAAAAALLPVLTNNYARAQTVAENDPRITAETVDVPGVQGLKGYLAKPKDPLPSCRPSSSSTRTAASIRTSRTSPAAWRRRASSRSGSITSRRSAARPPTRRRAARCSGN